MSATQTAHPVREEPYTANKEGEGHWKQQKVHAVTQQQDAKKPEDDAFYVFAASNTEGFEALELLRTHKMYFNLFLWGNQQQQSVIEVCMHTDNHNP